MTDTTIKFYQTGTFTVGNRLLTEEQRSVSEQKRTRAGPGHFVETVTTVRNQDGELVARVVNVLLRYCSDEKIE